MSREAPDAELTVVYRDDLCHTQATVAKATNKMEWKKTNDDDYDYDDDDKDDDDDNDDDDNDNDDDVDED